MARGSWFRVHTGGDFDYLAFRPEECAALLKLAAYMASTGKVVPDDEHAHYFVRMNPRVWKRVRQGLIERKFLTVADGNLGFGPQADFIDLPSARDRIANDWPVIRAAIIDRDGEHCAYCGTAEGPFEVDHITPISRGGSSEPDNLAVACRPCNRAKRDKTPDEWQRKGTANG